MPARRRFRHPGSEIDDSDGEINESILEIICFALISVHSRSAPTI